MEIREIKSGEDLNTVTGNRLTLVTFGAPWCAPCLLQEPILRRIAVRFAGRVVLATANIDELRGPASVLGIRSIPTLLVFRNSREIQRLVGLQPENVLAGTLSGCLEPGNPPGVMA